MNNEEIIKLLSYLIGTRYVPSVKAYISEITGRTRVVGVNEASTKELDQNRIHLIGDANNCIVSFTFG
nr:hypothetical protein [uncultured Pseudomonas sp.]